MIRKIKKEIASLGTGDVALIVSFFGIVFFVVLSNYIENTDLAYAFFYASFVCFLLLACLLIVVGVRDVRRSGFLKKKLISPICGVTLILLTIAGNAYVYQLDNVMLNYLKGGEERLQTIEQCLQNKELGGEERERISKSYAETYYYAYGDIIEVEKADGSSYPYDPYAVDNMEVAYWEADKDDRTMNILGLLMLLTVSLLIAFFSPLKKKRAG